ncbi:hypothetical protein CLV35_1544 [Motilibacter peucedani]|uniref:Tetratricopeptide repeat protein n=1 Tax=Motilibacter peucedani TaxID=598650 RepID=A0A420XSJ5_9ACTN|nr:hypothetical protein [Motilibacter peucedani]RKS77843.1 hypothetical protein CLV35_1544 [Motilibacter peucedani]
MSGPPIPEGITGKELPKPVLDELSTLPAGLATLLAQHLVAAGQLLDEDPEQAFAHASVARQRAPRLASTREAAGLAAYAAGKYAEAMPELRAATRMTGSPALLPVIADVERALGRPEKALEIAASAEAGRLDADGKIEMRLVAAGARRDLGQLDAAVLTLQVPEVRRSARLAYAFADALLAAGRRDEALAEFTRAAALDKEGETDADERVAELEGVVFVDAYDADDSDADDSDADDSDADDSDADDSDADDQPVSAPVVEPSSVEEQVAEEQAVEEQVADEQATEQPVAAEAVLSGVDADHPFAEPADAAEPDRAPSGTERRTGVVAPLFVPPVD